MKLKSLDYTPEHENEIWLGFVHNHKEKRHFCLLQSCQLKACGYRYQNHLAGYIGNNAKEKVSAARHMSSTY